MSNLVLYRKYRPQKFAEVVSQEHVKTTLANAVINGRVGHAYLFTGPRGVGKTTMARILSRAVNCPNMKDGEPCNECDLCKELLASTNLDLMEIDAASHTGVDNIRELIDHLQFAPARAKYKVIIVDEVHMLSKGAFNALLKTLEEPPRHAIFILATTEIHKVPATIVSRTQRFDFKKVSIADLVTLLKRVANDVNVKISDEALVQIAQAADGGFRDGLSLLDQVITYSNGEVTEALVEDVLGLTGINTVMEFVSLLTKPDAKAAVNFISDLTYSGRDLFQFQKDFLEYLRKLLLVKVGQVQALEYANEVKARISEQAQNIELAKLMWFIELFQEAGNELKNSSIPSLPLELAAVKAASGVEQRASVKAAAPSVSQVVSDESDPEVLSKITSSWNQILEKTKEYNHSLISSLKLAQPVFANSKELVLILPYKFHKDTIDARKNRLVVDQVIEEVTGLKLMSKPLLAKEWSGEVPSAQEPVATPEQASDTGMVDSALKIMGGEVKAE
jgi:DNA polymerase III subunit gamma/tau